jgi:quercetin dioxygenase-like cupin family protein
LKLLYVLFGTMEITDDAGTVVHHTGDFWVEAAGHSHTAHAVTDATIFSIDLLPPGAQATVPEAPATGPTNVVRTTIDTIDATGLFPAGPLTGTASLVTFPTGYMQKHYHGGLRFVYQLSGTIQLDDEAGTEVHRAGIFFDEPRGHVHTAHVLAQATNLVFDFLAPGVKSTYPLMAALPTVAPSGPGMSASFVTTFSSVRPGNGMVLFGSGPGCSGLVETAMTDSGAGTVSHSVTVRGNDMPGTVGDIGIVPGVTYWFEAVTVTRAGVEVDNNDGKCYSVTVPTS